MSVRHITSVPRRAATITAVDRIEQAITGRVATGGR